jgi:hypothetical protein
MSTTKRTHPAEQLAAEELKKKPIGDYMLWVWLIVLIVAGIFMAYKFLAG